MTTRMRLSPSRGNPNCHRRRGCQWKCSDRYIQGPLSRSHRNFRGVFLFSDPSEAFEVTDVLSVLFKGEPRGKMDRGETGQAVQNGYVFGTAGEMEQAQVNLTEPNSTMVSDAIGLWQDAPAVGPKHTAFTFASDCGPETQKAPQAATSCDIVPSPPQVPEPDTLLLLGTSLLALRLLCLKNRYSLSIRQCPCPAHRAGSGAPSRRDASTSLDFSYRSLR